MKKFLFVLVLFISCKKDSAKENTVAVEVSDSITGTPVAGADVVLWTCGNFGCLISSKTVFSGKTDDKGIVNITSSVYNNTSNELNVSRADYLPFEVQRSTHLSLRPKGWLRLRIVKVGSYPAGTRLVISNETNPYDLLVNAAADSILIMTGAGGVVNKVTWGIIDAQGNALGGGNGTVELPRLDTTNVLLNY